MKLNLILVAIGFMQLVTSENEIIKVATVLIDDLTDLELKSKEPFFSLGKKISYINSLVVNRDEYEKILKDESEGLKKGAFFFDAISQVNSSNYGSKSHGNKNIYESMKDSLRKLDKEGELKSNSQIRFERNSPSDALIDREFQDVLLLGKHKRSIDSSIDKSLTSPNKDVLNNTRRLFYATKANIHRFPYMASVHLEGRFACAGVVLSDDLVLTAANCLDLLYNNRWYRETPHVLSVRVGSDYHDSEGEVVPGFQVYFHANYNPKTLAFNVAVIRLEYIMNLTVDNGPRAAELAGTIKELSTFTNLTVLGWGVDTRPKYIFYEQQLLRKAIIPIISKRDCWNHYGEDHLGDSTFCGGTFGRGSAACGRDHGGPALLNGKVVGIVSEGPAKCSDLSFPTVFTHIGRIYNWIKKVTETESVRNEVDFGDYIVEVDTYVLDEEFEEEDDDTTTVVNVPEPPENNYTTKE